MPPPPAPAPPAEQAELPAAPPETPKPQQQQQAATPPLPMPPPPAPAPPAPPAPPQPTKEAERPQPQKQAAAQPPAPPRPTPTKPSTAPPAPEPSKEAGTGQTPPPPRTAERSQSVLSTLERLRAAQQNQPPRARPSEASGRPAQGGGAPTGTALLTAGEVRGVADRISECWSVDAGMLGLDQIVVELKVDMDPSGVIRNVRPASGVPSDPRARAVYESARRALLDQKCSPLPVPREKIPSLNNATFRFNPRGLVR